MGVAGAQQDSAQASIVEYGFQLDRAAVLRFPTTAGLSQLDGVIRVAESNSHTVVGGSHHNSFPRFTVGKTNDHVHRVPPLKE
ncbi:MAG TPA: hypothetical protein VLY24_07120 [Bryobacteraceae bacterium]|nr:hypothetical protein [Bryobacteraceae bacterium]